MAKCAECGAVKNPRFVIDGLCPTCRSDTGSVTTNTSDYAAHARLKRNIEAVIVTSETTINHGVVERYGFIMVEELKGGLVVGLEKMAEQLLPKLQEKAFNLGANAVVAVRIEAIKIMDVGFGETEMGKFVFVASGTAVKLSSE